jgi:hypothetical protein
VAVTAEPPPLLHPEMAGHYRQQVEAWYQTLQGQDAGQEYGRL